MTQPGRSSALCWSPLLDGLKVLGREVGTLSLLITPFATTEAVRQLLESVGDSAHLQVVCRWSPRDLVTGFADLSLYPYLRAKRVPLFRNARIHLKLYIFEGNVAFHASGNATGAGLGIETEGNIEVGCRVDLMPADWSQLYQLLDESEAIDDVRFSELKAYQDAHLRGSEPAPPLILTPLPSREYSVLSLPATPSPHVFADWYQHPEEIPQNAVWCFEHDRALYRVPSGLTRAGCLARLRSSFTASPFVMDFVDFLQSRGAVHFGKVKAWLQEHCSDKPVPFRRELTENTRVLYDWLATFYEEITWDRPRHSMVIRWKSEPPQRRSPERRRR